MISKNLHFKKPFSIVTSNSRSQAAEMTLESGATEGWPDNRHRGSDQWLYVVKGNGIAVVNGKRRTLRPGTLVLIQRGEFHKIHNMGKNPLRTLNFYVPPAYTAQGDELPAGRK